MNIRDFVRQCCVGSLLLSPLSCAEFQRRDEVIAIPRTATGRRVRVSSGRELYIEARGEGAATPVLFVHGFASNRETWTTLEPTLRRSRRTD